MKFVLAGHTHLNVEHLDDQIKTYDLKTGEYHDLKVLYAPGEGGYFHYNVYEDMVLGIVWCLACCLSKGMILRLLFPIG
jgi:hypothetical protein